MTNKTLSLLLYALTLMVGLSTLSAQPERHCRLGLSYELSRATAWGDGYPVIRSVAPESPAYHARLRQGDIVLRLDGFDTHGLTTLQVDQLLYSSEREHILEVRSMGRAPRAVRLTPSCRPQGGISERELAELFALYSLEDASRSEQTYPITYLQSQTYDLGQVRTYAIAEPNASTQQIDTRLADELRRLLQARGLSESSSPDLVFSFYYQLEPITPLREDVSEESSLVWRYDPRARDLKPLPIVPSGIEGGRYQISLGVQAHRPSIRGVIWSAEVSERLSNAITIDEYALYLLAPMFTGFPLVGATQSPRITAEVLRYNYTGIILSRTRPAHILSVEDHSPAYLAGLRAGDLIRNINGLPLSDGDMDSLLSSYYRWAERTDRYRDHAVGSRPLVGLPTTSYWSGAHYEEVAMSLSRGRSETALSYLFAFRPYITPSGLDLLTIEIERSDKRYTVRLKPELRDESHLYRSH